MPRTPIIPNLPTGHPSKKLIASYTLDWLIILLFAGAGAALSKIRPNHRPFTLLNLDISHPLVHESISTTLLGIIALLIPALLITLITLLFVPGKPVRRLSTTGQILRLKFWELEKGLAGLCLSVAVAFFITQGMKNLFGKPRPNCIAKCRPDLAPAALRHALVGGYGFDFGGGEDDDFSRRWSLVDFSLCTQTDLAVLDDGFRSFPSGHSSWSWSGLLYLTLYLCSKFAIGLPQLPTVVAERRRQRQMTVMMGRSVGHGNGDGDVELLPLQKNHMRGDSEDTTYRGSSGANGASGASGAHGIVGGGGEAEEGYDPITSSPLWMRNTAATPPNYLIIPALLPVGVAVYICSTRYAEFYHFGFDIISGSLIGMTTAYLSFRWYHLPIGRGQGWAWGARSRDRAFAIGVGTQGYVGDEGWEAVNSRNEGRDVEAQRDRA